MPAAEGMILMRAPRPSPSLFKSAKK